MAPSSWYSQTCLSVMLTWRRFVTSCVWQQQVHVLYYYIWLYVAAACACITLPYMVMCVWQLHVFYYHIWLCVWQWLVHVLCHLIAHFLECFVPLNRLCRPHPSLLYDLDLSVSFKVCHHHKLRKWRSALVEACAGGSQCSRRILLPLRQPK